MLSLYKTKSQRKQVAEPRVNGRLIQLWSLCSTLCCTASIADSFFFLEEPVTREVQLISISILWPGVWIPAEPFFFFFLNITLFSQFLLEQQYQQIIAKWKGAFKFITTVSKSARTYYSNSAYLWKEPNLEQASLRRIHKPFRGQFYYVPCGMTRLTHQSSWPVAIM